MLRFVLTLEFSRVKQDTLLDTVGIQLTSDEEDSNDTTPKWIQDYNVTL